jgi:hypothetical protein
VCAVSALRKTRKLRKYTGFTLEHWNEEKVVEELCASCSVVVLCLSQLSLYKPQHTAQGLHSDDGIFSCESEMKMGFDRPIRRLFFRVLDWV